MIDSSDHNIDDSAVHSNLTMVMFALIGSSCASIVGDRDARTDVADAALLDGTDIVAADVIVVDAGLCGDAACTAAEICIRGRCAGCCDVPPTCIPIPAGCSGNLACGCFSHDPCGGCTTCGSVESDGIHCVNCMCACAAPWTPIATPDGARPISSIAVGDLVYSVDQGRVVVVPVVRIHRTPVVHHAVARVVLANGETLEITGRHPTADGRTLDSVAPGERLGGVVVLAVETEPYDEPFTYDILPASDSGSYLAGGAWIGSTLR